MFTQNQVRQFYVADRYVADASGLTDASAAPGDIHVDTQLNDMYFNFINADGEVMRTDLIGKDKIMSITVTPSAKMKYTSKATVVMLSNDVIDDQNNPIAGEDYILNVRINRMNWDSDDAWGWKHGVVHTTSTTTTSDFYKTLAKSLAANISRDPVKMLRVYAITGSVAASAVTSGDVVEIVKDSDVPSGTVYGVVIDEAEQPWRLGVMSSEPVYFEANSDNVMVNGDEVKWGEETRIEGFTVVGNGKKIADMEWFYHGERGDIYREYAYPNNWPNRPMVVPTGEYDTIDIHYYWNGANHAVQKSEKDITIACSASGVTSSIIDAITGAVAEASGLTYSASGVTQVIL